jgi:hypothetical protein
MRRPRASLDRAMGLLAEGLSQAAVGRAERVHTSTISRWKERVARHIEHFEAEHMAGVSAVEVQLDELDPHGTGACENTWIFNGIEVWSRLWVASRVGPRTLRATRVFVRQVRSVLGASVGLAESLAAMGV